MRTRLIIIIAILVAAFSCPVEAQVKVKLNVKGLLNTVVKETEKTANKKQETEQEQISDQTESNKNDDELIIPLYSGSEIWDDHKIGFEEFPIIINDSTVQITEGIIRRFFCRAPEGRSALEVARNYEKAIKESGGSILFITRKPQTIVINGEKFSDIFSKLMNKEAAYTKSGYSRVKLPASATEYLVGKLRTTDKDLYIMIAIGPGDWSERRDKMTFFEIVTVEAEPMEMGMVTAADIGEGLSTFGRIPIYDIFFDTGQSEVKPESADALKAIAEYLNANETQKVVIVGHTDNVGDFDMNISLSQERANAVMEKLISEYGVNRDQLKPFGVGPVSPVESNSTEEGRAKNRRVEVVEQ
jgi:OOP family OmpA-OmpF porin